MITKEETRRIVNDIDQEGISLDYKEDLVLENDGDKAGLVKDVISLANSSKNAHIIIGVQNKPKKLVGLKTHHDTAQLNEILKDKCDPPISVEYIEVDISGHIVGVIEIKGENPPYIVSVRDKFGGLKTKGKYCHIQRGTVYVRNIDINEGASREHIEKMYTDKIKYITLQSDLKLTCSVSSKHQGTIREVTLSCVLTNEGNVVAADSGIIISFLNILSIKKCPEGWTNDSDFNRNPTVSFYSPQPILANLFCKGVTVQVASNIKQIDTYVALSASNMKTKSFKYNIPVNP
jgi:hypothetical protein